jgi:hypothetical protein
MNVGWAFIGSVFYEDLLFHGIPLVIAVFKSASCEIFVHFVARSRHLITLLIFAQLRIVLQSAFLKINNQSDHFVPGFKELNNPLSGHWQKSNSRP